MFTRYLGVIEERLRTCPSRMAPIVRELLPSVVRIAGAGSSFGIREEIYGDLAVRGDAVIALMRRVGSDSASPRQGRS